MFHRSRYSLSTISTRAKAHWLGPFPFVDLPPELRNRIYEYAGIEQVSRRIDLHHSKDNDAWKHLPWLLRVNKQLRDEAGSYFFSNGSFDILVDRARLRPLMDWLKAMGHRNRERLANNDLVTIRLVYDSELCGSAERRLPNATSKTVNSISFLDAAHLVGLGREIQQLTETFPGLEKWKFRSGSGYRMSLWPARHDGAHQYFKDMVFSSTFFITLRIAMKGIFDVFEEREVDLCDDGNRAWMEPERLWHATSGADFFVLLPKSRRCMSVYPVS